MNPVTGLTVQLPIVGTVVSKSTTDSAKWFDVKVRSGDTYRVYMRATTWFETVTNLDRLSRQRRPLEFRPETLASRMPDAFDANIREGDLIAVEGVYYVFGDRQRRETGGPLAHVAARALRRSPALKVVVVGDFCVLVEALLLYVARPAARAARIGGARMAFGAQ